MEARYPIQKMKGTLTLFLVHLCLYTFHYSQNRHRFLLSLLTMSKGRTHLRVLLWMICHPQRVCVSIMLCSCIFSTIAVYSSTYSTIHSCRLETCALTRRIDHGFSSYKLRPIPSTWRRSRWTQESIALTSLSRMQTSNYGLDLQACDPQTHWASLRAERCLTTNITDEWDFDFIMVMSECPQISLS